jgi:hypothetical protein
LGSINYLQDMYHSKSVAFPESKRPMINPKRPRMELKISIMKILTNLISYISRCRHCKFPFGFNLQTRISCIRQRCAASVDAHRYTANQVAHSHSYASPEQCIASEVV